MSDYVDITQEEELAWSERIRRDLDEKLEQMIEMHAWQCTIHAGITGIIAFAAGALRMHCAMLNEGPEFTETLITAFSVAMRLPEDDAMREMRLLAEQESDEG